MSKLIRIRLEPVTASGRREGWWFHVKGVASGRKTGFRRFEGDRLAVGECELPPMAVILLVRPTGSARLDARAADIMYADPASGELKGVAYGLPWAGTASEQLRVAVGSALFAQQRYNEASDHIQDLLVTWAGKSRTPEISKRLLSGVTELLLRAIPMATGIEVTKSSQPNVLDVRFSVPNEEAP